MTTVVDKCTGMDSIAARLGGARFQFGDWRGLPALPRLEGVDTPWCRPVGVCDRLAALILLLLLAPLMLLVAVAIKIDSLGGPVLFLQERVGLERRDREHGASPRGGLPDRRRRPGVGQLFQMCKFRTMVPNAERSTGPVWATEHDPRITRVGSVLRKLRIDEFPQLFNVLRGEMRLIGPRPERPHFVNRLIQEVPGYEHRLRVPPGITGLAQIEKSYDSSLDDVRTKVMYDRYYVENQCKLLDLKIIFWTLDVMVRGKGAR